MCASLTNMCALFANVVVAVILSMVQLTRIDACFCHGLPDSASCTIVSVLPICLV